MGHREQFEEMKRKVGSAPEGSSEWENNAAKCLSQWAGPGAPLRADTRWKLQCLTHSANAETRRIAWNALNGIPYSDEDDDNGDDDYDDDYSDDSDD